MYLFRRDAGVRQRLTRFDHLEEVLSNPVRRPSPATPAALGNMDQITRAAYDLERIRFLSGGVLVSTADIDRARKDLALSMGINSAALGIQSGLLVTGDAGAGKSTLCLTLMRSIWAAYTEDGSRPSAEGVVPIAYVVTPPHATGKQLLEAILKFYGLRAVASETQVKMAERVVDVMTNAGTEMVVFDEIHRLKGRSANLGDSVDVLRDLMLDAPPTFVLAGIRLDENAFLAGAGGDQVEVRFSMTSLQRFGYDEAAERDEWASLIRDIESELPLRDHKRGALQKHAGELHRRTNGSFAALTRLIRLAAIEAIMSPRVEREAVTLDLLAAQASDRASDRAADRLRKSKDRFGLRSILDDFDQEDAA
ncbi:TniB family NTP-binding protein [Curtobacterium sp. ISL-83]|uniref:TniB family NTP-binding protein n=1 Tax=Curtobacterium sp. ISL-83 TaxID=2819145 RepID=UPI001BE62C06|nr:TniB family NTP-binding protein [Curtobacterium sp. ISL-83]MBT2501525.1 ATP-binding protein [Curtobacterium sp. ISL-83]